MERSVNKLIGYEYSSDDWNNKAMLLQVDAYMANGDEADARVLLETMIEAKPKQEYLDEAQKKLEELNSRQQQQGEQNQGEELKLKFNQTKKDSALFNSKPGE